MASKDNKRRIKDTTVGGILGLAVAIPVFFSQGLFEPRPYNNVTVEDLSYINDNQQINVEATFVKTEECDFQDLKVFGEYLGSWTELRWHDPTGDKGDRYAGYNTLLIEIETGGVYYSKIEVRTRHLCNESKVDETFLSREPDDYIPSEQ
mgnify:FL=1